MKGWQEKGCVLLPSKMFIAIFQAFQPICGYYTAYTVLYICEHLPNYSIGRYSLRNIPPLRKGPGVGAKSSYTADEKFIAKHCTVKDGHVCCKSNRQLPFIFCWPRKTNFHFPLPRAASKRQFAVSVFRIYIYIYIYIYINRYIYT
jgi:hypothetical protein